MITRRSLSSLVTIAGSGFVSNAGGALPFFSSVRAKLLVVGDSMMVGTFGETLLGALETRFGVGGVAMYGSCGSSPECWLPDQPVYVTRCGFRSSVGGVTKLIEYQNGKRPPPVETPKIDNLLQRHRPQMVVMQFGTNWFERFSAGMTEEDLRRKRAQVSEFIALTGERPIAWILPPDCVKFGRSVQLAVRQFIVESTRSPRVRYVDSLRMTRYVMNKTGSDGIHYNGEDARAWGQSAGAAILGMLK